MKATKHSLIYNNHIDTLNELADFLLRELKVDVRLNQYSRKDELPKYRAIFFNVYLNTYDIIYRALGMFLDKDHTSVTHAVRMWNREYIKDYGYLIDKFKESQNILNLSKDAKIKKLEKQLQEEIESRKIEFARYKENYFNNQLNPVLNELLHLDDETINFVCETRLKPFLKMHKNKVTNKDLIQKQILTRKM